MNNEGRRINGPARRVFLKTHLLGVKNCLFGWSNFTGFALIKYILRKISAIYERAIDPQQV
tara:strand:- start:723 stop:905 length:183 start_codon:yes stop_codon:yes gene_type:complete